MGDGMDQSIRNMNLDRWNELTSIHAKSAFYDLAGIQGRQINSPVFSHGRQSLQEPAAVTAIGEAVTRPTRRWVPRRVPVQGPCRTLQWLPSQLRESGTLR